MSSRRFREAPRRPLVQPDRRVSRRGVLGAEHDAMSQAFTTGTEQEVDFLVAARSARTRAAGARCRLRAGPPLAGARAARASTSSASTCSPDFIALRVGVGRRRSVWLASRAFRGRRPARARVRRASSTPSCACARAGSACSAAATTKARCSDASRAALRPGGRLAVSAFNAYFALRHLEAGDTFDAARGVNHERATLRDAGGDRARVRPLDDLLHAARADAARSGAPVSSSTPCTA